MDIRDVDSGLIDSYLALCNDPKSSENDIQSFLEDHSQLIPLPILENHNLNMNIVISKLKLGNDFITDFAYLTKSTVLWKVVLIELENPHANMFKESNGRIEFSSEFYKGLDQIHSWQLYIDKHKNSVLNQLEKLRVPMEKNPTYFEYVLIIGRRDELTEKRRELLAHLMQKESIKILSFDSLTTGYTNYCGVYREKIVLSPCREQGYKIKKIPQGEIDSSIFSMVSPDFLDVNKDQEARLMAEGYDIKEWRNGYSLMMNNKSAVDLLGHKQRF